MSRRPDRVKLFVCRFYSPDDGDYGYRLCREITPIIARDESHALSLVWKHHGEYLAGFYGHPLRWTSTLLHEKMSKKVRAFLQQKLEIEELKPPTLALALWSNASFVSEDIRTPVG
jgi:hypothetical protein